MTNRGSDFMKNEVNNSGVNKIPGGKRYGRRNPDLASGGYRTFRYRKDAVRRDSDDIRREPDENEQFPAEPAVPAETDYPPAPGFPAEGRAGN